jgi:hypothetical protein
MEQELKARLNVLFVAYQRTTGRSPSTVAQAVAGDWRFFDRLEDASKTITLRKYDQIIQTFSDLWPCETPWPDQIGRPTPSRLEPTEAAQ